VIDRRAAMSIAFFALPAVLTKASALFLASSGPVAVQAVPAEGPAAIPRLAAERRWTPAQQAAAAHVAFLRTQEIVSSPLMQGDREQVVVEDAGPDTGPEPPSAALQVILDAGPESVAYFDGKRVKVGDRLPGSDWTVAEINGPARSVTVAHPSGETYTYHLATRGR
jgi:hypothetical protein